jgi:hypothetical protein
LKEKGCGKVTKSVLFLHENVPAHQAHTTQKKMAFLCFQCIDNPFLFSESGPIGLPPVPGTEKKIESRNFSSDTEVIVAAETWFD